MSAWRSRGRRGRRAAGAPLPTDPPTHEEARSCAAPHTSLYLDPSGVVSSCCANSMYRLGQLTGRPDDPTLESIWRGDRLRAQREALDSARFDHGCAECGQGVAEGRRPTILAREFDRYWPDAGADLPVFIDFALSNTCNLQCAMCNGDLSSAIRGQREHRPPLENPYGERFFEELAGFLPNLQEASFKGGEPFLSRETRRVWDMLLERQLRPRVTVTTNGTQWNDRVERYVRDLQMHVILSVDGATNDTVSGVRVGTTFDELDRNIENFARATASAGGSLVLNYCLMPQNWHEFGQFLLFADRRRLPVHTIQVVAPPQFSLRHLPLAELVEVVDQMKREGRTLQDRLQLNCLAWTEQMSQLERLVEMRRQPSPTPVTLGASPRAIERRCQQLRAASGADLLELTLDGGEVTEVRSTQWADDLLAASSWKGLPENQLLERIGRAIGSMPMLTVEPSAALIDVRLGFDVGAGPSTMQAVAIADPSTGSVERVFLARPVAD